MHRSLRRISRIEIATTPMADIAFLLIVFFMLTSVFSSHKGIDHSLAEGEPEPASPLLIRVTENGNAMMEGQVFSDLDRATFFRSIQLWADNHSPVQAVVITKDGANYGATIRVIDALKQHDFEVAIPVGKERSYFDQD